MPSGFISFERKPMQIADSLHHLHNPPSTTECSATLKQDTELLTDLHKEECKEALDTITLRLRVVRSHQRWCAADLVALKQQRKILSSHMAALLSCGPVDAKMLRQIDHDLAVCHSVLSNPI